ncbi:hypothetical protein DFH09DRAFT_1189749 [Mycena vulgaris]|nr:hypothetical protein DFH09DRAFT_1189749 [Mycena vulgaris]
MAICVFFQRGLCRFGALCRNDHVGGGNQSHQTYHPRPAAYTTESIQNDLTMGHERPMWPFTSYGPAKFEPTVLHGLDESPEELRLKATNAMKAGNVHEYARVYFCRSGSLSMSCSLPTNRPGWLRLNKSFRMCCPMFSNCTSRRCQCSTPSKCTDRRRLRRLTAALLLPRVSAPQPAVSRAISVDQRRVFPTWVTPPQIRIHSTTTRLLYRAR